MSYFRRHRHSGPEDDNGTSAAEDPKSSTQKFTPYSLGGTKSDASAEAEPGDSPRRPEPDKSAAASSPDESAAYDQLGEHVSTVLSSADEAAKRLKATATQEAKRIQGEAEEYARKTRADADAYSEQRRKGAETQAAAITADAGKRAGEVVKAAEGRATDIQREAIARRDALLRESERSEERLRNLLKVFHAMTDRLENLVSASAAPASERAEASGENELTEALAESRGSAASRPGESRTRT